MSLSDMYAQILRVNKDSTSDESLLCPPILLLLGMCVVIIWLAYLSWNTLFGIFGECWVCPANLGQFLLINFVDFGRRKEAKSFW